jgi:serine protease inhibitor
MKTTCFKTAVSFFFVFSVMLFSCKKESSEILPTDPVQINLSTDQVALLGSENSFSFEIFRKVVEKAGGSENVIISPLSISYALSMTLNGASGATRDGMLEALRVNGITPEVINNSYKNLSEALLNVDSRVLISIANSVWTEKNFVVKKSFTDILTGYYNAESKSFDITNPLAHVAINNWIDGKTNGLIKNMVDKLNDNTVMLLINAIYYKGKWKSQFEVKNTAQRTFYKPGGLNVVVPMMKQTDDFKIYQGTGFTVAEFPYGQGNFVMDVILPDDHGGVNGIIPILNESNFKNWLNQMRRRETDLSFPRFKYGYKKQLKDILSDMGMGVAFSGYADFSNISDLDLLINDVTHQAFIETNEEGTEAAAATVVDIGLTSMPVGRLTLSIDHSFVYIIREITTNTILFMGRVANPLAN